MTERRRLRAAEKNRVMGAAGARPLTPAELAVGKTKHVAATEPLQPGVNTSPMMSPSQLGFKGNLFGTLFGGSKHRKRAVHRRAGARAIRRSRRRDIRRRRRGFAYGVGPKQPLGQQGVYNVRTGKEGQ